MDLPTLVLASASPRRRRLLEQLGLPVEVRPSAVDEDAATGPAEERVATLARRKADAIASALSDGYVLGADTLASFEGDVLGKPADQTEAIRILWRLADRTHDVYTGVSVAKVEGGEVVARAEEVVTTKVLFRPLSLTDIRRYIDSEEYHGKAGGYAIQGLGRSLVAEIDGSYTNVVGLPLGAVQRLLDQVGYPVPDIDVSRLDVQPEEPAPPEV